MPAESKSQQHFMGMVHAIQTGKMSPTHVGSKVRDAAKKMKHQDAKDFASTKTKDLPEHKSAATAAEVPTSAQPATAAQVPTPTTTATPANEATKESSDRRVAEDLVEAAERATAEAAWQVKQANRLLERYHALSVKDEELAKRASAVDTVVRASLATS